MIKYIIPLILFAKSMIFADTTIIALEQFHQFFGNSGNMRSYVDTINFPENNLSYSEVFMNVSLDCPAGGCDPWDRKANIQIKQFDEWFEIGRYVTPYGIGCSWVFDVTDYRSILKGEKEIKSYIDTWVQPGWLVTIEFDFISGQPFTPNTVVRNVWNYDYMVYGDESNPPNIETVHEYIPEDVQFAKLRITTTGHGQGNTENAAEFSYKIHDILIDGQNAFLHDFWRNDCEFNSCSPQFGTWQFDRAGFCPGDKVMWDDFNLLNLHTPGEMISLDYVLEDYLNECSPNNSDCIDGQTCTSCDYNNNGHTEPFYFISSQLIYYTESYHSNADTYLYLNDQDSSSNQLKIYFENYVPVYGIQFTLDISDLSGSNLQDIEFYSSAGGRGEENGWTFSINNQGMLIGLSQDLGTPLLPGEGLLTVVEWNGNTISNLSGEIGIVDSEVSGYFGSTLSNEIGPDINLNQNLSVRKEKESRKRKLKLNNPYPNPFNPMIKGDFFIDNSMIINLSVYNLKGELVDKIFSGEMFNSGTHHYLWNAEKMPNGVYIVRLETDYEIKNKKIILLK